MNKAITDGILLTPPAFGNGLDVWSREDGRPNSATYDTATNAAFVPADQDFGGALEIQKLKMFNAFDIWVKRLCCLGAICGSRRGLKR